MTENEQREHAAADSRSLEHVVRAMLEDALSWGKRTVEGGRGEIAQTSQIYYAGRASALQDALTEWENGPKPDARKQ